MKTNINKSTQNPTSPIYDIYINNIVYQEIDKICCANFESTPKRFNACIDWLRQLLKWLASLTNGVTYYSTRIGTTRKYVLVMRGGAYKTIGYCVFSFKKEKDTENVFIMIEQIKFVKFKGIIMPSIDTIKNKDIPKI